MPKYGGMSFLHQYVHMHGLVRVTASFESDSPSLDGEDDNDPSHQEGDQAHGDSVHEHGVEFVVDHSVDSISALGQVSFSNLFARAVDIH